MTSRGLLLLCDCKTSRNLRQPSFQAVVTVSPPRPAMVVTPGRCMLPVISGCRWTDQLHDTNLNVTLPGIKTKIRLFFPAVLCHGFMLVLLSALWTVSIYILYQHYYYQIYVCRNIVECWQQYLDPVGSLVSTLLVVGCGWVVGWSHFF